MFREGDRVLDIVLNEHGTVTWASLVDYPDPPGQAVVIEYDGEPGRTYATDTRWLRPVEPS